MPFAMLPWWVRGEWGMNPIHVSRLSYSNSGHTEQEEEKIRLLSDLFDTTEHSFDLPEELGHPYTTLLIAELNEQLAGFLIGRGVPPEFEILYVSTSKDFRRKGVGGALLEALERIESIETVYLEVRASNHAAIGLYRKAGFSQTGIRARYYREPEEDAVLMCREIPGRKNG